MYKFTFLLVLLTSCYQAVTCQCSLNEDAKSTGQLPDHVNIILIGATGDLAKKYLWKALYDLYTENYEKGKLHFNIYAAARKPQEEGRNILSQIMLGFVICQDSKCREKKKKFVEHVQYHQLKTEKDYKHLANQIEENTRSIYQITDPSRQYELGRIVYMSIPPSSYANTGKLVNKHLRPRVGKQKPWLRVVVEKPFGNDVDSARTLSEQMKQYFSDSELYRIDHYLGKTTVKHILPFRIQNRHIFDPVWNARHIERVEIVMKETVDARGRINFYNDVGVIRDVMQNHITEMLALVAMDLPEDSGNIRNIIEKKVQVLSQISPVDESSVLLAQYQSYTDEAKYEKVEDNFTSTVPTFAAALLKINSSKWKGVPFVLLSGKKLDVKASYIRILFKNNRFCVSDSYLADCTTRKQLVFHIGGNNINTGPCIISTKLLGKLVESSIWKNTEDSISGNTQLYGQNVSDSYILRPLEDKEAYAELILSVLNAERHKFVDNESLMKSWELWSPLLQQVKDKRLAVYIGKAEDAERLDFEITPNGLKFYNLRSDIYNVPVSMEQPKMIQIPVKLLEQPLVTGTVTELLEKLSENINSVAQESILMRKSFHFALSGGNSPIALLKHLISNYHYFPWSQTHIWQVDERCVSMSDPRANMYMIQTYLLDNVDIPHSNIHSMPVDIGPELCDENLKGDFIYEQAIVKQVYNQSFDFLLLGVGNDGHTASLFPKQELLKENSKLVIFSEGGPESVSSKRMTLTFKAINGAHNIAVLATGSKKHDIIHTLSETSETVDDYPITSVKPTIGKLNWYVDNEALFGDL